MFEEVLRPKVEWSKTAYIEGIADNAGLSQLPSDVENRLLLTPTRKLRDAFNDLCDARAITVVGSLGVFVSGGLAVIGSPDMLKTNLAMFAVSAGCAGLGYFFSKKMLKRLYHETGFNDSEKNPQNVPSLNPNQL